MPKFKFNFAGLIASLVGIAISGASINQHQYIWLIGGIPLIIGGMILQLNFEKEEKQICQK